MDTHQSFCSVAQAADLLTLRWMPLVLRELLCGSHRFNDLHRGLPRMSRTLLARRLADLVAAGVAERRPVGADAHLEYHLTQAGEELRPLIMQLGVWGKRWVRRDVTREALDPTLLMWDMQRRIVMEALPPRRVVVSFHFPDAPAVHQQYWLVLKQDEVDLCLNDPGHDVDLNVFSNVRALTDVWTGDLTISRALRDESVRLSGPPALRRAFPDWLGLSLFAATPRQPRHASGGGRLPDDAGLATELPHGAGRVVRVTSASRPMPASPSETR